MLRVFWSVKERAARAQERNYRRYKLLNQFQPIFEI